MLEAPLSPPHRTPKCVALCNRGTGAPWYRNRAGGVFLLFVLYGLSSIALGYLCSFAFTHHAAFDGACSALQMWIEVDPPRQYDLPNPLYRPSKKSKLGLPKF